MIICIWRIHFADFTTHVKRLTHRVSVSYPSVRFVEICQTPSDLARKRHLTRIAYQMKEIWLKV